MSHFGSVARWSCVGAWPGIFGVALLASAVAGCARQPQGQQTAHTAPQRPPYCEPRPTPDCEFKETSLRAMDPEEFNRLKLAYERRCIRRAEKTERERMRELQSSGACEGRPAPSLAASR